MNKAQGLEVNYKAYTLHLIRQKLPYFLIGLAVTVFISFFIFKRYIISKRVTQNANPKTSPKPQKKYTVQEGEDLWQIAEMQYGSGFNAYDIAKANKLSEPYILQAGQILIIPEAKKRFPTHGEITDTAASTSRVTITGSVYTVQEGDYLFSIAERVYGDGNLMNKIIDANNIPYPYDIEAGQVLKIPR